MLQKQFSVQETPLKGCFLSLRITRCVRGGEKGDEFIFLMIVTKFQHLRNSKKQIIYRHVDMIQGATQQNLLSSSVSFICPRGTRTNGDTSIRIEHCGLRMELYNVMK